MTQSFNKKISIKEMNDNLTNPNEKEHVIYLYEDDTKVRSISFVHEDGDRKNLFYHNLITSDYIADSDSVLLYFTSGTYQLTGKNMLLFYKHIRNYRISEIMVTNQRYIATLNLDDDDIAVFSFNELVKK